MGLCHDETSEVEDNAEDLHYFLLWMNNRKKNHVADSVADDFKVKVFAFGHQKNTVNQTVEKRFSLFLGPIQDPTHACSGGSFQVLWKEKVTRLCHQRWAPPAASSVWTSSPGFVCSSYPSFPVLCKASFYSCSTACFLMTTTGEKNKKGYITN